MSIGEPKIHHPRSQRLDARLLATLFGIPLIRLADAIGRNYATLRKSPDSSTIQESLAQLFRIWDAVYETLNEDEDAVRRWFHRPNRGMSRERPLDLLVPKRLDELEEATKGIRYGEYA